MSFINSLKRAIRLFTLDEKAIEELSKDKKAGTNGFIIIAIAGLCLGLGLFIIRPTTTHLILLGSPLLMIITTFIGISVLFIISKLLGGKGNFSHYYRAFSHVYLFNWIAVIPVLGPLLSSLAGVWQLIMAIYITKVTQKLNLSKSAIVVLVPAFILLLLTVFTMLVVSLSLFLQYFLTLKSISS